MSIIPAEINRREDTIAMTDEGADFGARVTALRAANARQEKSERYLSSKSGQVASAYDPITDWTNYDSYNKFYSIYVD
jgi:hypothetical protein